MLIVGQGAVGKTSLIKQLVEKQFDQHETKTEGIAVTKWHISVNRLTNIGQDSPQTEVRLNIFRDKGFVEFPFTLFIRESVNLERLRTEDLIRIDKDGDNQQQKVTISNQLADINTSDSFTQQLPHSS